MNRNKNISFQIISDAKRLFAQNNWTVDSKNENSKFNKFCNTLSYLNQEQTNLILELTSRFEIYPLASLISNLVNSINHIPKEIRDNTSRFFVYPLSKPFKIIRGSATRQNQGKPKSSHFLFYMFDSMEEAVLDDHDKFYFEMNLNKIMANFNPEEDKFLLIDDFIGTGDTAVTNCKLFFELEAGGQKLSENHILIATIAAQKEGVNRIKNELNIDVFADHIRSKGITDQYVGTELKEKTDLMNSIENRLFSIDFLRKYRFGYGECEALIKFLKPPNNTFPLYWAKSARNKPTFPRHTKSKL